MDYGESLQRFLKVAHEVEEYGSEARTDRPDKGSVNEPLGPEDHQHYDNETKNDHSVGLDNP